MANLLGFTICDPCGHPWVCGIPKEFLDSEIDELRKKIKRESIKVRKTTQKDIDSIKVWSFDEYLKRIKKP